MNGRTADESSPADGLSLIRQGREADGVTVSTSSDDRTEAIMPVLAAPRRKHEDLYLAETDRRYVAPMTAVNSVIAAIDARRPGLSEPKTQLLLFFCQGHHLAHSGDPLFTEPMYATDSGVTVDDVHDEPAAPLRGEGPLNTIGYTISRYGNLSPADLRTLVQASQPWQLATKSTTGPRIEWAWLTDWFRRPAETNDPDDDRPTKVQVAAWLARRRAS